MWVESQEVDWEILERPDPGSHGPKTMCGPGVVDVVITFKES